tara:strand:- start:718 stop:1452 length:735 start_codon:yes stop_codon:yes gene_type:complete
MENIITTSKINKRFGGIETLTDVDLELRSGEILGLVGDNGAGKSTFMKILSGAYQAESGRIIFEGKEVEIKNPKQSREIGIEMVYQDFALCRRLDIASNLFLGRELYRSFGIKFLKKKKMLEETIATLKGLKINIANPKEMVNNLSGGQQQAVAIGKAFHFNPKVVLMDEPTANLAVVEAKKVRELMIKLKNEGISIMFVTHNLQDVFEVCDRVFVLKGGKKVDCLPTNELDQEKLVKLMFIGK